MCKTGQKIGSLCPNFRISGAYETKTITDPCGSDKGRCPRNKFILRYEEQDKKARKQQWKVAEGTKELTKEEEKKDVWGEKRGTIAKSTKASQVHGGAYNYRYSGLRGYGGAYYPLGVYMVGGILGYNGGDLLMQWY